MYFRNNHRCQKKGKGYKCNQCAYIGSSKARLEDHVATGKNWVYDIKYVKVAWPFIKCSELIYVIEILKSQTVGLAYLNQKSNLSSEYIWFFFLKNENFAVHRPAGLT